jgi:hypothetical protein
MGGRVGLAVPKIPPWTGVTDDLEIPGHAQSIPRRYRLGMLAGVRLTEFNERVVLRFGAVYGASVLIDHVLTGFGGRSAAQAIEDGVEPRDVWWALCVDFDVPRDQW